MEECQQERYEVRNSEKLGRYMVASRDLKSGEVLICEWPLAVGPACDSPLLCFACHAPLSGKFSCCATCARAPVCGQCDQHSEEQNWHDEAECSLFASSPQLTTVALINNVSALLPLRCFLKRRSDPLAWQQLMMMEHHLTERRGTDIWTFHHSTVQLIVSLGLVSADDERDLVQRVCGILDVNCFELRGPRTSAAGTLRGIYPLAALMAHHCCGNTHLAVGSQHAHAHTTQHALTVRAATFIPQGGVIFYNYVDPLEGTARRQERLRIGKYFTCECTRCLDPTELSTDLSSVLCPTSHCRGLLLPPPLVPNHPDTYKHRNNNSNDNIQPISCTEDQYSKCELAEINTDLRINLVKMDLEKNHLTKVKDEIKEHNANGNFDSNTEENSFFKIGVEEKNDWKCLECGQTVQTDVIENRVKACSRKLDSIDKSSEDELSEYVNKVSLILSPCHYLVLSAQQALAGTLRARIQREPRPTTRLLRQYVQLCRQLLHVLDLIQPEISRAKAITLYECQAASVMLARKLFEAREMTADVYMEELTGAQELLKQSTSMLVLEPSASPEGALCARALHELRDLRTATQGLVDANTMYKVT